MHCTCTWRKAFAIAFLLLSTPGAAYRSSRFDVFENMEAAEISTGAVFHRSNASQLGESSNTSAKGANESKQTLNFFLDLYITRHGTSLANVMDEVRKNVDVKEMPFKKYSHAMLDPPLVAKGVQGATQCNFDPDPPKNSSMPIKVAVLSSVLMRAKQTAVLQFMNHWKYKFQEPTLFSRKVLVVPWMKEAGSSPVETANNIPRAYLNYPNPPPVNQSRIDCCKEDGQTLTNFPSEMFDETLLRGSDGVFGSDPSKFINQYLPKSVLPKLFPNGEGIKDGRLAVIAIATHSNLMNSAIIRDRCQAVAWPHSEKAANNQVVKLGFNVKWESSNPTSFEMQFDDSGCKNVHPGVPVDSNIRTIDDLKEVVGAPGLKSMRAVMKTLLPLEKWKEIKGKDSQDWELVNSIRGAE